MLSKEVDYGEKGCFTCRCLFAHGYGWLQQLWKDQYTHACAAKTGFKDRTNDSSTEI
jgi:hypothetical protein